MLCKVKDSNHIQCVGRMRVSEIRPVLRYVTSIPSATFVQAALDLLASPHYTYPVNFYLKAMWCLLHVLASADRYLHCIAETDRITIGRMELRRLPKLKLLNPGQFLRLWVKDICLL